MRIERWRWGNIVIPCDINYDGVKKIRLRAIDKILQNIVSQQRDPQWQNYWVLIYVDRHQCFNYITKMSSNRDIACAIRHLLRAKYPPILLIYDTPHSQFYRIVIEK